MGNVYRAAPAIFALTLLPARNAPVDTTFTTTSATSPALQKRLSSKQTSPVLHATNLASLAKKSPPTAQAVQEENIYRATNV